MNGFIFPIKLHTLIVCVAFCHISITSTKRFKSSKTSTLFSMIASMTTKSSFITTTKFPSAWQTSPTFSTESSSFRTFSIFSIIEIFFCVFSEFQFCAKIFCYVSAFSLILKSDSSSIPCVFSSPKLGLIISKITCGESTIL